MAALAKTSRGLHTGRAPADNDDFLGRFAFCYHIEQGISSGGGVDGAPERLRQPGSSPVQTMQRMHGRISSLCRVLLY